MDKCEHGTKITHFCTYEYCAVKEAGGCDSCMKKFHSHVGHSECIRVEDVEKLAEKFNVENSVKPKCRQFQEHVFGFFTQVKTQISQTIDIFCKGLVNKIGYPLLSQLNHLSSYKRIKSKEYKKLNAKQLKKMCLDCRSLDSVNVTVRERQLYIEEIIDNFATVQAMERLMKQYETLAKKMCKNFKHDSSPFKKIQDLRKYLFSVLKINGNKSQNNTENEDTSKITSSLLETSPSDQNNLTKQKNIPTSVQQKQPRSSSITNKEQKEKESGRQSGAQNRSRSKYKHIRNFSIEKDVRLSDSVNDYEIKVTEETNQVYESKEKEILERKQKLMKMMSLKDKSVGKHDQSKSSAKATQSILVAPPLLKYQKNLTETPNGQKEKRFDQRADTSLRTRLSESRKPLETPSKVIQTPIKQDSSRIFLMSSPKAKLKKSLSIKSLKEELIAQNPNCEVKNQDEEKYKYGMVRLPSSESNSSDNENLFKFQLNCVNKYGNKKQTNQESLNLEDVSDSKIKKDRMTESLPLKQYLKVQAKEEIITDQEKSAGLYLIGLEKTNLNDKITYFKAALSYSPRNISAAEMLTWVYIEQNKAKECLDLCNEYINFVIRLSKPELKKHFITNKSVALNLLGRYSESIMLLQSELVHFEEAKMYKNLGDAYFAVGINEKCQYNYEKAVRLNPKLDQAMYNLAVCIFCQSNYFNADIWISKALQISPKNPDYKTLKKQILIKLGKINQQNQHFA